MSVLTPAAPATVDDRRWPGPEGPAPRKVPLAAVITAVVAAATISWTFPGVGWLATAIVATAGVLLAVRPPRSLDRLIWTVLALALVAMGTLRAAGWLWALCVPTAFLCAAFALGGGRTLASLARAAASVPVAAVRALPWTARGVAGTGARAVRAAVAGSIAVALLIVFGTLLSSADAAFAEVLNTIVPAVDPPTIARWVFTGTFFEAVTLAACFLAARPPRYDRDTDAPRPTLGRLEWAVPIGALVVLFAGFVVVQATVGFGGGDHVLGTAGLTYAEYARQGFWQLLAVTVLTLVVVAVAARFARRQTAADRAWVRGLLGALAALTLVIVASALSRMWAYEQAYGLTRLRLLVAVCEAWLGVVYVLILASGVRLRGAWIPRVSAQIAAACLIGLAIANPDALIARENIDRYAATGRVDFAYLATLSDDAVPQVQRLTGDEKFCVLFSISAHRPEERWTAWNYGRARGYALFPWPGPGDRECRWELRQGETIR
jgi:hypothetical protein